MAEAREAHAFWRERLKRLPWFRRAARAEARAEMAARWQRRMLQAELDALAAARPHPPAVRGDGLVGAPSRGVAARQATKRALRVSPLARMVADWPRRR